MLMYKGRDILDYSKKELIKEVLILNEAQFEEVKEETERKLSLVDDMFKEDNSLEVRVSRFAKMKQGKIS